MGKVKRYSMIQGIPDEKGDLVAYKDFQALETENEQIKGHLSQEVKLTTKLYEENTKLKGKWISIDDRLPDLEVEVIVQYDQDSGTDVFWGQRREVAETKRIDGSFQPTGKRIIEWGYDENGEYWNKLNVTYWQPFPEIKKK